MKRFAYLAFLFSFPLISICLIGELAEPEYGDLFRMARLTTDGDYPADPRIMGNRPVFPPVRADQRKVVVIGDSFLTQADPLRNVQVHFPDTVTTFTFSVMWCANENPFQLLQSVRDSLTERSVGPVDAVILETAERRLIPRLMDTRQDPDAQWIQQEEFIEFEATTTSYLSDGVKFIVSWIFDQMRLAKTASHEVVKIWLDDDTFVPIHAKDLVLKPSIDATWIPESIRELVSKAETIFPGAEVRILICPDKGTIYRDFIEQKSAQLVPDWKQFHPAVVYPAEELYQAQNRNLPDVYRYGDTHFGVTGAEIASARIFGSLFATP